MLLTFGVMALVRIQSTEGLTQYAPGEFGLVLGLDRAPEMKTARRKLAGRNQAREFSRAFSERWATEAPAALGYLYLDGHVRPYHGRTLPLPKTHVPRRRLCMPATTDYWVHDAHAEPLEALGQDRRPGRDRLPAAATSGPTPDRACASAVLHHAPDEPQDRQRLVLDRLAAMVPAPRSSEAGPLVLARLRLRPPRCGRLPPR